VPILPVENGALALHGQVLRKSRPWHRQTAARLVPCHNPDQAVIVRQ
jgi:hypothetical protein